MSCAYLDRMVTRFARNKGPLALSAGGDVQIEQNALLR